MENKIYANLNNFFIQRTSKYRNFRHFKPTKKKKQNISEWFLANFKICLRLAKLPSRN